MASENQNRLPLLVTSLTLGGQVFPFNEFLLCYVHMEAGIMSLIFSGGARWPLEAPEHQPLGAPAERLACPSWEPRTEDPAWGLSSQITGQAPWQTPWSLGPSSRSPLPSSAGAGFLRDSSCCGPMCTRRLSELLEPVQRLWESWVWPVPKGPARRLDGVQRWRDVWVPPSTSSQWTFPKARLAPEDDISLVLSFLAMLFVKLQGSLLQDPKSGVHLSS